jgi:hypothetical protein
MSSGAFWLLIQARLLVIVLADRYLREMRGVSLFKRYFVPSTGMKRTFLPTLILLLTLPFLSLYSCLQVRSIARFYSIPYLLS